ncbi:MAG: TlyA family rRNA (cytidine-2'-O)-methyltransferase, partial [Streptococcus sp.]|nr:TlyA family rRNA (cytidine-2'-O)-methyltransferase [Streptococcus sp.]
GGSGNIEFLAHLKNTPPSEVRSFEELARETVKEAQRLKK